MKYGIIGTGAIGGYYGGKLAKDGQEVHFLMHRDYEYVKQHGLQVDSCDGSFHLDHVHAYAKTSEMPPCDVVLVCLKSTNNQLTMLIWTRLRLRCAPGRMRNGADGALFPRWHTGPGAAFPAPPMTFRPCERTGVVIP